MATKAKSNSGPTETKQASISMFSEKTYIIGMIVLLLVGFLLRLNHLTADPPPDLSWSLAPYTDEGAHVVNAKNEILFGNWMLDEWFRMGVSPLFSIVMFAVFKLFGFGYFQARIVSVISAVGVTYLIFLLLRKSSSTKVAFIGALLATTSYLWIMQNRMATEESFLALVLLLAILFWIQAPARIYQFFVAGFLSVGAVLFVKLLGIFFLPILPLEFIRQRWLVNDSTIKPLNFKPILLFIAGGILAAGIWFVSVYLPFPKEVSAILAASSTESAGGHPQSIGEFLKNIFTLATNDHLTPRAWIVFPLAIIALFFWTANIRERIKRASPLEFISALWFLGALFLLSSMNYRPIRYQMILLPAAFILASLMLDRLWQPQQIKENSKAGPLDWALRWIILSFFAYNILWTIDLFILNHSPILSFSSSPMQWAQEIQTRLQNFSQFLPRALIASTLGLGAWIGLSYWRRSSKQEKKFRLAPAMVLILLGLSTISDISQYAAWSQNATYSVIEASRDLRNLPPGSAVAGPWAGAITLEASVRAIEMQQFCNVDKVLERFPVTHLAVFGGGWEQKYFTEKYPEILNKSRIWKSYTLPRGTLFIVELPKKDERVN